MRKTILLTILIFSIAGGIAIKSVSEPEPTFPIPTEAVELPPLSPDRASVEDMGREALRTYIIARLSMEKIAKEEKTGADLAAALQETTKHWLEARIKAQSLREAAVMGEGSKVSLTFTLMNHAYASMPLDRKHEEALTDERQRIIQAYADYPYSHNLGILSAQIEQDADMASIIHAQVEGGEISCREAAEEISENCKIRLTARSLGGKLQYSRPEGQEAFAWFWGGDETFVSIAPEGSILLLDRGSRIVFIVNDAGIVMGEKELSEIDVDAFLTEYANASPTVLSGNQP